ncbi:MAG: hypothetical protein J0L83_05060 [Chitinophagales bacterium]|nr:hypothetical protein [Chitinophagales bacterium]
MQLQPILKLLGCCCLIASYSFKQAATNIPYKLPPVKDTSVLSLFEETSFKRLMIDARLNNNRVKGFSEQRLPENRYELFDFVDADKQVKKLDRGNYYLIGKRYKISDNTIGLLMFGSDDKISTSSQLFVWDIKAGKIVQTVYLATSYGDEEGFSNAISYLEDVNGDKKMDIVNITCSSDYSSKKKYQVASTIYLFNGQRFIATKQKADLKKFPAQCK